MRPRGFYFAGKDCFSILDEKGRLAFHTSENLNFIINKRVRFSENDHPEVFLQEFLSPVEFTK